MNMRKGWLWGTRLLAGAVLGLALLGGGRASAADAPKKLLIVTVTKGFKHSSIPLGSKTVTEMGEKSGAFTVDYVNTDQEMAEKMTAAALKNYDGVVFVSTTGTLPLPDKTAFLDWVKSGKAVIGIHAATDSFHMPRGQQGVDPMIEMWGGEFQAHGAQVKVECLNLDPKHPATSMFGKSYEVFDEIYEFKNYSREKVHVLLTMDKHPQTKAPGDYAVSWCKKHGAGNVFYTSLGHREDVWAKPEYQEHLLGGIKWALGLVPGDATLSPPLSKPVP